MEHRRPIVDVVRATMEFRRISQTDAALIAGVSRPALNQFLKGKGGLGVTSLELLLNALGVELMARPLEDVEAPPVSSCEPVQVDIEQVIEEARQMNAQRWAIRGKGQYYSWGMWEGATEEEALGRLARHLGTTSTRFLLSVGGMEGLEFEKEEL